MAEELTLGVRAALARHSPRRAGRILELALGFAIAEARTTQLDEDVARAARLADGAARHGTFHHRVDFAGRL